MADVPVKLVGSKLARKKEDGSMMLLKYGSVVLFVRWITIGALSKHESPVVARCICKEAEW